MFCKICIKGACLSDSRAPLDACGVNEDLITQNMVPIQLTAPQMTCSEFFTLIEYRELAVNVFCLDSQINRACCQSCRSMNIFSNYYLKLV